MKRLSTIKKLVSGFALSAVVLASPAAAMAAPAQAASRMPVAGPQAKAPVEPGSKDAKLEASRGATKLAPTNSSGTPTIAAVGAVSGVDFLAPLNYCSKSLVYTPVKNTTASAKSIHVRFNNQGGSRDVYTSVPAGGTSYVANYGVSGAYTAYLYVWNGSSYVYDEYKTGTHTCKVVVTRVNNSGGWVRLKIQNTGTAYASQLSTELAPYPAAGTYTGAHYDYPVAGGGALYRWFQVGTQPYGIMSHTVGSSNAPYIFTGDL